MQKDQGGLDKKTEIQSALDNANTPSTSVRVERLLEWHSGKVESYEDNSKHFDFSGTFVSLLLTVLKQPDEELISHILERENGRKILISAFENLIPKIAYLAKKSESPKNYSGPFPGPLMAMSRDRMLANFIKTWEDASQIYNLPELQKIIANENQRLLQLQKAPRSGKNQINKGSTSGKSKQVDSDVLAMGGLKELEGVRPYDVFNGSSVKRKYKVLVRSIISAHSASGKVVFRGSMGNVRQGYEWDIFGGVASESPAFWGRPSILDVPAEDVRAKILILMGVSLNGSKTYSRYKLKS